MLILVLEEHNSRPNRLVQKNYGNEIFALFGIISGFLRMLWVISKNIANEAYSYSRVILTRRIGPEFQTLGTLFWELTICAASLHTSPACNQSITQCTGGQVRTEDFIGGWERGRILKTHR